MNTVQNTDMSTVLHVQSQDQNAQVLGTVLKLLKLPLKPLNT
jgi:hypothetical protein